MCYLFPIGACTAFTGLVALVSLAASGLATYAALPFFLEPDSITFAINGHGVCLEPRLDAPCREESGMTQCGGSLSCCYGGYNCGYDPSSQLSYCEDQCRVPDAQCTMFVDGSVDFEWPDVPLRVCVLATALCAGYHFILALLSLCTGGTARCFAPWLAGAFVVVQAAVVGVAVELDFAGFFCGMEPLCFHPGAPADSISGLCAAAFNLWVFGAGSAFMGLVSVGLYVRRRRFIKDLIAKRDYIPDEELELVGEDGQPTVGGEGWGVTDTSESVLGKKLGKKKSTAVAPAADGDGEAAAGAAGADEEKGESKEAPEGDKKKKDKAKGEKKEDTKV